MSDVIFKYTILVTYEQLLDVPVGAKFLTIQTQHNQPRIWAIVDDNPTRPKETRKLFTFGTGHPMPTSPNNLVYIGTYLIYSDTLVWHVFEERTS